MWGEKNPDNRFAGNLLHHEQWGTMMECQGKGHFLQNSY